MARKKAKTPVAPNDAPSGALTMARKVAALNRWRDAYNPLRGLKLQRAIGLLENYPLGYMADLQWTYFFVEQTDADLFALVERRTSALLEMDWDAKIVANPKDRPRKDFDQGLADEQQSALQEAYNRIENLYEAVEHMVMATFRGYAHAEKLMTAAGDIIEFGIVDQWNVVRDGLVGDWKYNPEAQQTSFDALPAEYLVDPERFIIRTVPRHVDRLGLIKFLRTNLSQKDWDAFIEIYGIPGGVIIGPPNVPEGKEAEYESAAQEVAQGGSGYLPNQSDYKPNDGPRGVNPFRDHLDYLSEKLILAGTGGLLTMLTQSGSGTLAGNAHQETFEMIAKGDARKISEIFQEQLDKPLLAKLFPGKPVLSYFALAQNEETDSTQVVTDAKTLGDAGYDIELGELSEKSGYTLTKREVPDPNLETTKPGGKAGKDGNDSDNADQLQNRLRTFDTVEEMQAFLSSDDGRALLNRSVLKKKQEDALISAGAEQFAAAQLRDMQPVSEAISTLLGFNDANFEQGIRNLRDGLPQLLRIVNREPATAEVLAGVSAAGFFNGFAQGAEERQAA